jgi:hypothetical protein
MAGARRIITGHKGGRSVVVADERLEEFGFGPYVLNQIWSTPTVPPPLPFPGEIDTSGTWFPPPGAIRSWRAVIKPEASLSGEEPSAAELAEVERLMPGALATFEPDRPGMHTSQTVDIGLVQSGEIWLELDDENEVKLGTGDYVIQNGTRHAWHNRSDEDCVMTFVVIGAAPQS